MKKEEEERILCAVKLLCHFELGNKSNKCARDRVSVQLVGIFGTNIVYVIL